MGIHPELFRPLIDNLFTEPKEERESIALKFIEQYAICITDAKNKLLAERTELEYVVNNQEVVKKQREDDLTNITAQIAKLDEDKATFDEQVVAAKNATEQAETDFQNEE